jgi:hypothetical protein
VRTSFIDWIRVPRDLETIGRSFQRKMFGLDNRSSHPLLSGDTFKYLCQLILEGQIEEQDYDFPALQELTGTIFAQAEPVSNATKILVQVCQSGMKFPNADLVIHNGDVIPNPAEMLALSNSFRNVYSVNWLGDSAIAAPLPIGLENRDKRRNGVPIDYLREISRGLPSHEERDIVLLVAFSLHTNFEERSLALECARDIRGAKIITKPITPRQYRNLVLRSRFVLSPPGNGPDCHRTWEALYLGATPIVHRDSWPFQAHGLPVLQVDSWGEIELKITNNSTEVNNSWKYINYWIPRDNFPTKPSRVAD